MSVSALIVQFLNGLADASSLFLVAVGLSLIFGVSRIVNFAHGSLYMLGAYVAYSVVQVISPDTVWGFWLSIVVAAFIVALAGLIIELSILRRIYKAPELFQLLATFALVLVINDATLWFWGPEDLLGPLAPGLSGSVPVLGAYIPQYDLLLIVLGPFVLYLLWRVLRQSKWGALLRAATQDRSMLAALGVNQAWLFSGVFTLGAFLAGLGGALQLPRQPANLGMDISIIAEAFVVVVVGGMGSIPGAYIAALLIAQIKAFCIALGTINIFGISIHFPSLTLVAEFLLMAVVLIFMPWGLFGKKPSELHGEHNSEHGSTPLFSYKVVGAAVVLVLLLAVLPAVQQEWPYLMVLALDMMLAILFALSLYFMMGPGGMYSFGHAAYFGLGAYGAALVFKSSGSMGMALAFGPLAAVAGAAIFGWFCVRLSGVYLAMLTLAFAQIVWSVVYQWDSFTGGSNGIFGIWPADWLSGDSYYWFCLTLVALMVWIVFKLSVSSFGYFMRAARDSELRAQSIGLDVKLIQWQVFMVAGLLAGIAGALFVFSKGSVSPEVLAISKSVDGLLMVLLGGLSSLAGPVVGAVSFQLLEDFFTGISNYWHALFGGVIIALVLLFPGGLVSSAAIKTKARQ